MPDAHPLGEPKPYGIAGAELVPEWMAVAAKKPVVRTFDTGANRDVDTGKHDYEGFLSPAVLEAFGEYMTFNRQLRDGSVRDSDNWQKGIPFDVYMKSLLRHVIDAWREHRGLPSKEGQVWALCAIIFNAQGYLHELIKAHPKIVDNAVDDATLRRLANEVKAVAT